MKIAQISLLSQAVPPERYGAVGRIMHWLTEELVRSGEEVDLYAPGDSQTTANLKAGCERGLRQDSRMRERDALTMLMIEKLPLGLSFQLFLRTLFAGLAVRAGLVLAICL